jgi:hypothetical protein
MTGAGIIDDINAGEKMEKKLASSVQSVDDKFTTTSTVRPPSPLLQNLKSSGSKELIENNDSITISSKNSSSHIENVDGNADSVNRIGKGLNVQSKRKDDEKNKIVLPENLEIRLKEFLKPVLVAPVGVKYFFFYFGDIKVISITHCSYQCSSLLFLF